MILSQLEHLDGGVAEQDSVGAEDEDIVKPVPADDVKQEKYQ